MKKLFDISWQVEEDEYRKDPALSYSTLARYERTGFNGLSSLFDHLETPSLSFGSAVDSIITGGEEEFKERFVVATGKMPEESVMKVVKFLYNTYNKVYDNLLLIPISDVIAATEILKYRLNWKDTTRVKNIREQGEEYYKLLILSKDKSIIDIDTYNDVRASVRALKESEATKDFFALNTPFNQDSYREYQLKFKHSHNGVNYRCMADLLYVNHVNKTVYPIDLKTSGHPEWDFPESFITWSYSIQARLYWRIIRANMDKDPFWKEYNLADYRFIVVNRYTLTPLVWEFEDTTITGTLQYGKNKQIILRDPYEIGAELNEYLQHNYKVPMGINTLEDNSIVKCLNNL